MATDSICISSDVFVFDTFWLGNRRLVDLLLSALKIGDAARVAPIDKLSVVLVAVFGVVFLGEALAFINWVGVLLIASGAVLVAYNG